MYKSYKPISSKRKIFFVKDDYIFHVNISKDCYNIFRITQKDFDYYEVIPVESKHHKDGITDILDACINDICDGKTETLRNKILIEYIKDDTYYYNRG